MKFTSTRNNSISVSASAALLSPLCKEGGLFVPQSFPRLDYKALLEDGYADRAAKLLKLFFEENKNLSSICSGAYSRFEEQDAAPLIKLDDNLYVLELWHGATCAFKDIALSVLPELVADAKTEVGDESLSLVLTATSGDTGKAALEGFKDKSGTFVVVLYPNEGVSEAQRLQMCTQEGGNVLVLGISGNFDDAQRAVKSAMNDKALSAALNIKNIKLTGANSVNFGRLAPQTAYYFSAYADIINAGFIRDGEPVDFCVPSGNFGNILAGYYAKKMGLNIGTLICASNKNNVLTDFINTGVYNAKRPFYKTSSPSMDILVSSNLERLIFELSNRDAELTARRMESLNTTGSYSITKQEHEDLKSTFGCGFAGETDCAGAILDVFDEYGYVLDPHTAAAYSVLSKRGINKPTVLVSTANPYKFAPAVLSALGQKPQEGQEGLEALERLTAMEIPPQLSDVYKKDVRFNKVIEAKALSEYLLTIF